MIATHRRALIRARNNLWFYVGAAIVAVSAWYMVETLARLGTRLARTFL